MSEPRVAGCDPGTSSLDIVLLEGGVVVAQQRFSPSQVRKDPSSVIRWLSAHSKLTLVAAPSGYGLPLVRVQEATDQQKRLLSLVRPEERGAGGVAGFSALVESFSNSDLPAVFLPGVIHLPGVPSWRKINRIDLGTPDKVCVAALALAQSTTPPEDHSCVVVELGSAFTACVVIQNGSIVDGMGGTLGGPGWASGGGWDGELAYLIQPLSKSDLFHGGCQDLPAQVDAQHYLTEGIVKVVAGLIAVTEVQRIFLSGRLLEISPSLADAVESGLRRLRPVQRLDSLPGAWVKHAAQGAAIVADGLSGGRWSRLVQTMGITQSQGTVLDGVVPFYRSRVAEWLSANDSSGWKGRLTDA